MKFTWIQCDQIFFSCSFFDSQQAFLPLQTSFAFLASSNVTSVKTSQLIQCLLIQMILSSSDHYFLPKSTVVASLQRFEVPSGLQSICCFSIDYCLKEFRLFSTCSQMNYFIHCSSVCQHEKLLLSLGQVRYHGQFQASWFPFKYPMFTPKLWIPSLLSF